MPMRMEDDNNSGGASASASGNGGGNALNALVASQDWQGIVSACEEALLAGACRAGAGHAQYAPHLLALLCLGNLDAARHLWRQRGTLPPQPPSAVDAAATEAAKALWLGDAAAARTALAAHAWSAPLAAMAEAASVAIMARGARTVALAYRRASPAAVAHWCGVPVDQVPALAGAHAWDCDTNGTIVPGNVMPGLPGHMSNGGSNPTPTPFPHAGQMKKGMERVAELADQLVLMQTTT